MGRAGMGASLELSSAACDKRMISGVKSSEFQFCLCYCMCCVTLGELLHLSGISSLFCKMRRVEEYMAALHAVMLGETHSGPYSSPSFSEPAAVRCQHRPGTW